MADYTFNSINNTLLAYLDIAAGCCVSFDDEPTTSSSMFRAKIENQTIRKADIDCAIDAMGEPGIWLSFCHDVDSNSQDKLNRKQKRILKHIYLESPINWKGELIPPVSSICEIADRLNGTYKAVL